MTCSQQNCIMCKNPKYTWYEVMADCCGKPNTIYNEILCDVHSDIFFEQLQQSIGENKNAK